MLQPVKRLQPQAYRAFRCIGADCEDSCCTGWIVSIDKLTYEAYQRSQDPELGPRFRELVTIHPAHTGDDNYARITASGPDCPFLSEGLCAIQRKLGEDYLSLMCATYPRVMNVVDDVLERSLDLSCPEAARKVLLDPAPLVLQEDGGAPLEPRLGHLSVLQTRNANSSKPYRYFPEIRALVVWLLQYRAWPLWKRLVILGSFCDQLEETAASGRQAEVPEVLEGYRDAVNRDLFARALGSHLPQPAAQLELVLELIVGRISADFTTPRFLACYQQFMQGIEWTTDSTMDDLGRRYASAFAGQYARFLDGHSHMLEHYLVSSVHRTLFPLGPQESARVSNLHYVAHSIREHGLLLLIHYGIIQTVLVGMAAFHKENLAPSHAVQVIQSFTKAFEHSVSFPKRTLRVLAQKEVRNCASLAMLLRN